MSREEQVIEEKLENLLNAIIIYRDVEKKALQRITELLAKKGITVGTSELSKMDEQAIREKLREAAETRRQEEMAVAEKHAYEVREEERGCRR